MCGGFRASRKFAISKENQIEAEQRRLARLRQGFEYTWPTTEGNIKARFGGHSRSENLDSIWKDKIVKHVRIEAEHFSERDTVGGSKEFKHFKMPAGKAMHGIITKDGELRIVTQKAVGNVAKVHHRMPRLIDIQGDITPVVKRKVIQV